MRQDEGELSSLPMASVTKTGRRGGQGGRGGPSMAEGKARNGSTLDVNITADEDRPVPRACLSKHTVRETPNRQHDTAQLARCL